MAKLDELVAASQKKEEEFRAFMAQLGIVLNCHQDICDALDSKADPIQKLATIKQANEALGKALITAHPHLSGESAMTKYSS